MSETLKWLVATCGPVFFMCIFSPLVRLGFLRCKFSFGKIGAATYFILF